VTLKVITSPERSVEVVKAVVLAVAVVPQTKEVTMSLSFVELEIVLDRKISRVVVAAAVSRQFIWATVIGT
jgi:hypothetical protein